MNINTVKSNAGTFSNEIILKQTDKILKFRAFEVSQTLRKFLSYIINETLSGREGNIKEYTIAIYVLKKKNNPQALANGIVRVHARRLREALISYYVSEGLEDDCIISVPKGRYQPVFLNRNFPKLSASEPYYNNRPEEMYKRKVLGVGPFRTLHKAGSKLALASRISESLSMELSEISSALVISPYNADRLFVSGLDHAGENGNDEIQYIISGHIYFETEKIMVFAELTDVKSKIMLWSYKNIFPYEKQCLFDTGEKVVQSIVKKLDNHSVITERQPIHMYDVKRKRTFCIGK